MTRATVPLISAAWLCLCITPNAANAEVIASLSTPDQAVSGNGSRNIGQSITTPGGTSFDNLTFNFYRAEFDSSIGSHVENDPFAQGELFLLDQEYLGVSGNLSASTNGFLASTNTIQADGSGFEWVFDSSVRIDPGTQYFFYATDPGTIGGFSKAVT